MTRLAIAFTAFMLFALAGIAAAAAADARPVGLWDATARPDYVRTLKPHRFATARGCWLTEYQAYRYNGGPLANQRRHNGPFPYVYWRDSRNGGNVTFDGITFVNNTQHTVIVAGWCS